MRWHKIEFFTHGTLSENRIRVVERQYSTLGKAGLRLVGYMRLWTRKGSNVFPARDSHCNF